MPGAREGLWENLDEERGARVVHPSPQRASLERGTGESGQGSTSVYGRILTVRDMTDAEVAAWLDLARRAVQPNPLFEADCLVPAARHLRNGPDISLVVAEESGRFFGCFPVQRRGRWLKVPRPVFQTQVRRVQYDGTPILDTERGHEAMVAMLRVLAESSAEGGPGLIVFDWMDDVGPASVHLRQAALALGLVVQDHKRWVRPELRRRPDGDYRSIHSRKFLHNVARLRRRLEEDLGAPVGLADRRDDPAAIGELLAMAASGYKGDRGIAMGLFGDETAWFVDLCERYRATGRLFVWALQCGERALAFELGVLADGVLFLLEVTYDEAFARYTPGVMLHLDVLDHLNDTAIEAIDSCTYEHNQTMLRIFPDRRSVAVIIVVTGGLVDRSVLALVGLARRHAGAQSVLRRALARARSK
jgi:hypothetical protein